MPAPDLFDFVGNPGAERLRGTGHVRFTYDEAGNPVVQPEGAVCIGRSPEGAIDDLHGAFDAFYHCGHPRTQPLGSKCAVNGCNRLSCQACSAFCERCLVPLCREHESRLAVAGQQHTYCAFCRAQVSRTLRWKAVGRFLIQPFIAFDNKPQP